MSYGFLPAGTMNIIPYRRAHFKRGERENVMLRDLVRLFVRRRIFGLNLSHFSKKLRLRRKPQLVFSGKNCLVVFWQCHFDKRIILVSAQKNANRLVFARDFFVAVVIVDIHLQLPQILMSQLTRLKFQNNKTAQQTIVEYKIGKELIILQQNALLPSNKTEAITKLKDKLLQMIYNGLFYVAFIVMRLSLQSQELQAHRIFYDLLWRLRYSFFPGNRKYRFLVIAKAKALPKLRVYLPLRLTCRPAVVYGF